MLALTVVSGVFAGAEIALLNLRKTRLRELVDKGVNAARAVQSLRDNPERLFATIQVGITVMSATAATFGGAEVSGEVAKVLQERAPWLGEYVQEVALTSVVVLVSFLTIVVGELVPKSLALRATEQYALLMGGPVLGLAYLLRPVVRLLTATSNVFLALFGDKTNFSESRHSPEEISQLVEEAARSGAVDPKVGEIANRALEFGELTAWDVMVAKADVIAIPKSADLETFRAAMNRARHTRIPVYENDADNIVGYVSTKDLLPTLIEGRKIDMERLLRRPKFVPESVGAVDLLQQLQRERLHMAFVVDEQGGMCGIVTFDDLVEELVGEFFGEHHRDVKKAFEVEPDGSVLADGSAQIRDINREFDWELPEDENFSTLAGLAMSLGDRIPEVGAVLTTDTGFAIEVLDSSARRVRKVRVRPPAGKAG